MLLEERNAVIYGGAGAIGSAVAAAFAREGAMVHLVGRTQSSLGAVVDRIRAWGGRAEATVLDALDEVEVDEHVDIVSACYGSVDISFNLISVDLPPACPLSDMEVGQFDRTVVDALNTQFITARAAARHMICQRWGVILTPGVGVLSGTGHGLDVAAGAIHALRDRLADELEHRHIRVVEVDAGADASPSDIADVAAHAASEAGDGVDASADTVAARVTERQVS